MKTINKTSERFNNAVTKLYNAFHKGELNAMDCRKCAVGNMCNGLPDWRYNGIQMGFMETSVGVISKTGYSLEELLNIEAYFMYGVKRKEGGSKHRLNNNFDGLCAVVEYLCELEGIPNVMDYSKLFETENNEPKYKLENVLV